MLLQYSTLSLALPFSGFEGRQQPLKRLHPFIANTPRSSEVLLKRFARMFIPTQLTDSGLRRLADPG